MEFLQHINYFYALLMFGGLFIILEGFISFWQQGVASQSLVRRLLGLIVSVAIALVTFYFSQNNDGDFFMEIIFLLALPIALPLIAFMRGVSKMEVTVKKYNPQDFFAVLERNLEQNGYDYQKDSKADDVILDRNYVTSYTFQNSADKINIKWADLDSSEVKVAFQRFYDKDLIREVIHDLRESRTPISFFKFTRFHLLFGIALILFSAIKLAGY